jgi:hypothetical protein
MSSDEDAPFLKEPPLMIAIVGTALVTVSDPVPQGSGGLS